MLKYLNRLILIVVICLTSSSAYAICIFGVGDCSTNIEVELDKFGESLEEAAKSIAELKEIDPDLLGLKTLLRENSALRGEVNTLNEALNRAVLGRIALQPGSRVVFEVDQFTGSFELGAWIGQEPTVRDQFIFNLVFPDRKLPLFKTIDPKVNNADCYARVQGKTSTWVTAKPVYNCGTNGFGVVGSWIEWATTIAQEANSRFQNALTGNHFGVDDEVLRKHTISLRTGLTGDYPVNVKVRPLSEHWSVRYKIYEDKDGEQQQIAAGNISSRQAEHTNLKVGELSELIFAANVNVYVPIPMASAKGPGQMTE